METQRFKLAEGWLAYDDQGSGPLVLCVPSMGDLRQEYRRVAPMLVEAGYRVVTMDVRGHGETSVRWDDHSVAAVGADMLALIRYLNAGPALIIGTSMAAGAAIWAAVEAPQLVAGLVLIGPVVEDGGPLWLTRLLFSGLFARPWGIAIWRWYFARLYPTRRPADWEQYLSRLTANLKEPGRLRALRRMITASKRASGERVAQVKVPALIIMGTRDPDFKRPEQVARDLGARLQAPVVLIEGAGHYPHVEMPEEVRPHLNSFFGSMSEEAAHGNQSRA